MGVVEGDIVANKAWGELNGRGGRLRDGEEKQRMGGKNNQRGWLIKRTETLNPDKGKGQQGNKGEPSDIHQKIITALTPQLQSGEIPFPSFIYLKRG